MGIEILKENKIEDIKGIHLFDASISNNAMRVRLLLAEKNLTWESHTVNLASFEQFEPEYLNINPQGSIPTMIHDGVSVYGSENILRYLEKMFPSPNLTSENEELMWAWVESGTRTHIETAIGLLYSKRQGRPARIDMLSKYKDYNYDKYRFLIERGYHMSDDQKKETLNIIHAKLLMLDECLKESDYIMGSNVTVADIAWLPDMIFIDYLGFDFTPYTYVVEWMSKMKERPSYNKKTQIPKLLMKIFLPFMKYLASSKKYLR